MGKTSGASPISIAASWLRQAKFEEGPWHNVFSLATINSSGGASCRAVLVYLLEDDQFTFCTETTSRKNAQISHNPQVALSVYWPNMSRQVRLEGVARMGDQSLSDRHFSTLPHGARIMAHASLSGVPGDPDDVARKAQKLERELCGREVGRPDYWRAFTFEPTFVEFLENCKGWNQRCHRFIYNEESGGWQDWFINP
ncbi:pyridoxamine 5'-phosphate oxidase family protein [Streptomyces cinereoruber]|uniref:pyridoxamine 5'-phosphate oxidase family protein n=1 Tax=Streptomyces cinereoruber TaxID=67260 RepID=UPI003635C50C